MSDEIELQISPHADVANLCDDLYRMQQGLRKIGLEAPALERARDMLKRQSWEIHNSRKSHLGAEK